MEILTNNLNPWHIPQRQSPAAIFIMLGKTFFLLLKVLWPVFLIYLLRKEREQEAVWHLWMIAGVGITGLLGTFITYWFKKFYIREGHLIVQSGWLKKKNLSIPFQHIQAVHLEQNVWQQALKVAKVSFDATGSEKVEVQLEALPTEKAEELKRLLMGQTQGFEDKKTDIEESKRTFKLGFADLLKLSLTANHLEAFFILLLFSFNILNEIKKVFDFDEQEYISLYAQEMVNQTAYIALTLLAAVAIISLLFSIVRTILKFYDFSLTDKLQAWRITFGLINRQQKTIPINKIQIISWRASWLRRKFDYWIMLVQSVGHSQQHRKLHLQIPILAFAKVIDLAESYQAFTDFDTADSHSIEPAYWFRKSLFIGLPFTLIPMMVGWYWLEWWSLSFLLIGAYLAGQYYFAWKNFRWHFSPGGLQILSGAWGRKYTLLNWSKVQQVHLHQSPYQRRNDLANVVFLTAGGKVRLPYLSLATATALTDRVLYEVESRNKGWM